MAVRSGTAVRQKTRSAEASRAEKRLEILVKAREVFGKYGYRKTSVEDVGRACGLAGPAIYYYFSSKEELFAETIRASGEMEIVKLRQACFVSGDPKKQVFAFILFLLKSMQEFTQETQLSDVAAIIPLACEAGESCYRAKRALLEQILKDGQHSGAFRKLKIERTAALLMSSIAGSALDRMRNAELADPEEDAVLLAKLLLEGICR